MVKAPGASAVLVANPADRMIYYYKEGMAAPMGSFRTHDREPLAVQVVDRSLRERRPGVYETTVRLVRPGDYDIAMFLDAPQLIHCFPLSVGGTALSDGPLAPVVITPVMERQGAMAGVEMNLQFRLSDPLTKEALKDLQDVQILTFRTPGTQQQRHGASQTENGVYEASFVPQQEGIYYVFLQIPSLGLEFKESRPVILEVAAAENSWGRMRQGEPVRPPDNGGR